MGGIGSLLPLLLLSGMNGVGVSADLIKNIQEEKKQSLERWKRALTWLATLILGYIFYMRAPTTAVDSAGKAVYNEEGIQKSMEKMFQENAYASFIKDTILSTIDTVFELLKPSASESLLYSAILTGPKPAASSTTVIQQQPPVQTIPWIGSPQGNTFQNLRGNRFAAPRAQGAVIMPDGTILTD